MNLTRRGVALTGAVLAFASLIAGAGDVVLRAGEAKDLLNTKYRPLPATRAVADLDVDDFFDNMESGFFANLEKTGPGSFELDLQQPAVYGGQGTLRVWFHAMCDLRHVVVRPGERLKIALRWPVGNTHMRPVYSYDGVDWEFVPGDWGRANKEDTRFRFEVPLEPGRDRVYFAANHPYPSQRVLERAIDQARNRYVQKVDILARTERDRPILMLTITDRTAADSKKRKVLLTAGDHGAETASAWGMEGTIDFLLSDDPVAHRLRRTTIFYVVPILNTDGFALGTDRRQATGVNIYLDYRKFESREARAMWKKVTELAPAVWLDYHSWHLGKAEGLYGPHPRIVGDETYAKVKPLMQAIGKHFPITHEGPDTLDSPNTQALLRFGIPGFCPEFNFGQGADGRWKTIADQKALGAKIVLGLSDYLEAGR